MSGAVHDGRVDHLAGSALAGVVQRGEQSDHEVERAARVVAEQVRGDGRRPVGLADQAEHARHRGVADVVAGPGASGPSWPQPVIRP